MLIGAANTVLSLALQYSFLNLLNLGYWFSTSLAYVICSVISFFLNKKYSFKNEDNLLKTAVKFSLVIAVCYVIAYSVAQPFAGWIIKALNLPISNMLSDNVALLIGQVIFTLLNYSGQRFFAFKNDNKDDNKKENT